MMEQPILIIEFRKGLGDIFKQTIGSKDTFIEIVTDLKDLDRKSIPLLIKKHFYKLVIINYQMAVEYENFDILAYVHENKVPYALIYTSELRASKAYEIYALWSFIVTDEMRNDPVLLAHELNSEFALPPDGSLKFVL